MYDINNFWGENYYGHPKLTDVMVQEAENELGFKLPAKLIYLLKIQNGGYTKNFVFPMNQKTSWSDDHIPLEHLFGIVLNKNHETAFNIMDTEYMINEWNLPQKQILLCGEGHWWITLDYRKTMMPSVTWLDVDCGEDIKIAEDFPEFISGLILEAEFSKNK